jgi:hypothetical protein
VELLANGVVKVFSFEMLSNFVKGKKSQAEYLLTIAASADYFARVERSFKMIISGEPEWKIEFYSYE